MYSTGDDLPARDSAMTASAPSASRSPAVLEPFAFWMLVAIVAWAPFPIGSNHPWSWTVLAILVAADWMLVVGSRFHEPDKTFDQLVPLLGPILLASAALLWAFVQTLPVVPAAWAHPVWDMEAETIGAPVGAVVSLNPWRSLTEIVKLLTYVTAAGASYLISTRRDRARLLLECIVAIVALYAGYALLLDRIGTSQLHILYPFIAPGGSIAGPFVNRNNFATYAGIGAVCAIARLAADAGEHIRTGRGFRQAALDALNFLLGRRAFLAVAVVLTVSGVIASASRAGFLSLVVGSVAMLVVAVGAVWRRGSALKSLAIVSTLAGALLLLVSLNGDVLFSRLGELADTGGSDQTRLELWAATWRMIGNAPFLGLGLGTFENAYPLYADHALPFAIDKAHQDYLELAAGLGLPAAAAWLGALLWSAIICAAGAFRRRRDRTYAIAAFGAAVLVAVHSAFDFSMQIPAVALVFAIVLGLGLAQSFPTRDT